MRLRTGGALLVLLVLLALLATGSCQRRAELRFDSPAAGGFLAGDEASVSGRVLRLASDRTAVAVEGLPVPLDANGRFALVAVLDPARRLQSWLAELSDRETERVLQRRRVTAIRGAAQPAGAPVPSGLSFRLTNTGLARLAENARDDFLNVLDLEAQVRSANPVLDRDFCIVPNPLGGCLSDVNVQVDARRVRFGALEVAILARDGFLRVIPTVRDLEIDYDTDGVDCKGRLRVDRSEIPGSYLVDVDGVDATRIDVDLQRGSLAVRLQGVDNEFTGGVCDAPVIDDVIEDLFGNLEDVLADALRNLLRDPDGDGPGDSPVAEAIEQGLDPAAPIRALGDALGVELATELVEIPIARRVMELRAQVTAAPPAECGVALDSLWSETLAPPEADELTPLGVPYDAALGLSATALGQILAAQHACEDRFRRITEIELAGEVFPLEAGLLSLFLPSLAVLPPETTLAVRVSLPLPPLVNDRPGPGGERLDIQVGAVEAVLEEADGGALVRAGFDLRTGLDLAPSEDGRSLEPVVGAAPPALQRADLLWDGLGGDPTDLAAGLAGLAPLLAGAVGDVSGRIELPAIEGLPLLATEVGGGPGHPMFFFRFGAP